MKRLILIAAIIAVPATAKPVQVDGYIRRDGTYVPPHTRSSPNNTTLDNYSTKGNYNPYSGRQGTVDPYKPSSNNPWGSSSNKERTRSSY